MNQKALSWLVAGACIALVVLVANIILILRNTRQLHENSNWVSHTYRVISGLENVLSLAKDAETRQRGFLITGEPRYLEPFNAINEAIYRHVDSLERLTVDNPIQQANFPQLRKRINVRFEILKEVIEVRKQEGFEAAQAIVLTDRGKNAMDDLESFGGEMIAHERSLLAKRSQNSQLAHRSAILTELVSGLMGMAAVLGLLALVRRHLAIRAHSEATIAEQAERLRTTLASIGDAVITTDIAGRVTNINAVAQALTGWTNEEAIGQPLNTVFHIVNETTRQLVDNPAIKALAEGVIVGLANHTVLIAKGGAERAIDDSAAPIRCAAGELVGCVLVFRDITERRRADRELRDSEARKTAMFETALDSIISINHEGTITEFNAAAERTFGHRRDDVLGRELAEVIIPPAYRDKHRQGLARYLVTGEGPVLNQRLELSALHADGREFPVELTVTRIPIDGPPTFTAYLRDITEIKHAQDVLRQTAADLSENDRRKNEFLAMLAHELRNPLAPIRNAIQIVRLMPSDGKAVQSASEMMERQIAQLVHLVDDLLDVSRITRGIIELRRERVELKSIIDRAIETSRPAIDRAKHALTVALPPQPVYLDADPLRLGQVFSNLLNNACKYSEPGGRISLAAERQGSDVVVAVKDTGIGIPTDMLPHVFEMFTQVDRSLERSQGGLGIGLTLVQRLVEMHGGSVSARSEGPGRGSEFVVRLPILIGASTPASPKSTDDGRSSVTGRRILVVDDNRDAAISLAMLLKVTGNETRLAHDGLEAVEAASTFRPDVVLLDIGMPKLNGYEAARKIREQSWGKDTVLIALTGWGQEEDRRKSQEAGFDGHLVKPVELDKLKKMLGDLLKTPA